MILPIAYFSNPVSKKFQLQFKFIDYVNTELLNQQKTSKSIDCKMKSDSVAVVPNSFIRHYMCHMYPALFFIYFFQPWMDLMFFICVFFHWTAFHSGWKILIFSFMEVELALYKQKHARINLAF